MSVESFIEAAETTPGKRLRTVSGSISGALVHDEIIQIAEPINRTRIDPRDQGNSGSISWPVIIKKFDLNDVIGSYIYCSQRDFFSASPPMTFLTFTNPSGSGITAAIRRFDFWEIGTNKSGGQVPSSPSAIIMYALGIKTGSIATSVDLSSDIKKKNSIFNNAKCLIYVRELVTDGELNTIMPDNGGNEIKRKPGQGWGWGFSELLFRFKPITGTKTLFILNPGQAILFGITQAGSGAISASMSYIADLEWDEF